MDDNDCSQLPDDVLFGLQYQSLEPLKMRIMYQVDYYWAIEKNAYIKKIMRNKRIFQLK